jgi:hypothetical protein
MKQFFLHYILVNLLNWVHARQILVSIYLKEVLNQHVKLTRNDRATFVLLYSIGTYTPASAINIDHQLLSKNEARIKRQIALFSVHLWRLICAGYSTGISTVDALIKSTEGAPISSDQARRISVEIFSSVCPKAPSTV